MRRVFDMFGTNIMLLLHSSYGVFFDFDPQTLSKKIERLLGIIKKLLSISTFWAYNNYCLCIQNKTYLTYKTKPFKLINFLLDILFSEFKIQFLFVSNVYSHSIFPILRRIPVEDPISVYRKPVQITRIHRQTIHIMYAHYSNT